MAKEIARDKYFQYRVVLQENGIVVGEKAENSKYIRRI
jgi:hypothetical protein